MTSFRCKCIFSIMSNYRFYHLPRVTKGNTKRILIAWNSRYICTRVLLCHLFRRVEHGLGGDFQHINNNNNRIIGLRTKHSKLDRNPAQSRFMTSFDFIGVCWTAFISIVLHGSARIKDERQCSLTFKFEK